MVAAIPLLVVLPGCIFAPMPDPLRFEAGTWHLRWLAHSGSHATLLGSEFAPTWDLHYESLPGNHSFQGGRQLQLTEEATFQVEVWGSFHSFTVYLNEDLWFIDSRTGGINATEEHPILANLTAQSGTYRVMLSWLPHSRSESPIAGAYREGSFHFLITANESFS